MDITTHRRINLLPEKYRWRLESRQKEAREKEPIPHRQTRTNRLADEYEDQGGYVRYDVDPWSAAREMDEIAKEHPKWITPYAFQRLVAATEQKASAESSDMGFGASKEMFGGERVFEILIASDPAHYASLLARVGISRETLHYLIFEQNEREQAHYDLYAAQLGDARSKAAEQALLTGASAMVKVEKGELTTVVTGHYELDQTLERALPPDFIIPYLSYLLEGRPTTQEDYFPPVVVREVAKLLTTDLRDGALRFLQDLASIDLNRVLAVGDSLGKDAGLVLGFGAEASFDPQTIFLAKQKHAFNNLFTAWAVGKRELSASEAAGIREIELLLNRESSAVVYQIVQALVRPEASWNVTEVKELWASPLMVGGFRERYSSHIGRIFSLKEKGKARFLELAQRPGRLELLHGRPVALRRFEAIMDRLAVFARIPEDTFMYRLNILNALPYIFTDELFVAMLIKHDPQAFTDTLKQETEKGNFKLPISYGLQERINTFGWQHYEQLDIPLPNQDEVSTLESAVIFFAAVARFLSFPLADPQPAILKERFQQLALQCHPDRHGGDSQAVEKFRMLSEAKEIIEAVFEECAGDAPAFDPVARSFPIRS